MKKPRIWELDFLRGFAIIMMIFDHLMYDLQNLNSIFANFHAVNDPIFMWLDNFARQYWYSEVRAVGHIFFIALFLIVSGISFTFSNSNLKRGTKLIIVALLINVVTYLFDQFLGTNVFIAFGIIHMFAFSVFLTYVFRRIWNNDTFIFIIATSIIVLGVVLEFWKFTYVPNLELSVIPGLIIGTKAYGADSFGIVPNLGIMMIGTIMGNIFYKNKVSIIPLKKFNEKNLVTWVGRNSLMIFLLHQFVLYAIIIAVGYMLGYHI